MKSMLLYLGEDGESFFQRWCSRKNGLQIACYNIFISVGTFVEEYKIRRSGMHSIAVKERAAFQKKKVEQMYLSLYFLQLSFARSTGLGTLQAVRSTVV